MLATTMTLAVGAEKPFQILHIGDTHLYFADERDDERKRNLALRRQKFFGDPEKCLRDAVTKEACALIKSAVAILTGHLHFPFCSALTPTLNQYLVGRDDARLMRIV